MSTPIDNETDPHRVASARARVALLPPGQVVELRAPEWESGNGFTAVMSGYFDDPSKLIAEAGKLTPKAAGVYFTLNPVDPDLLARCNNKVKRAGKSGGATSNKDIVRRRWLPIDIDPIRKSGICATDAEKAAAIAVADAVEAHLTAEGWPAPLRIDSGNGYYLLYSIDQPADDGDLVKRCLTALARRFDTPTAHVDMATCNAAQMMRLPGTRNRKGDHTGTRPHRPVLVLACPEAVEVVPDELLQKLAEEGSPPPAPPCTARATGAQDHRLIVPTYLAHFSVDVLGEREKDGTRYWDVPCPFCSNSDKKASVSQFPSGATGFHCFHDSCSGRKWKDYRQAVGDPLPDHYDPPKTGRTRRAHSRRANRQAEPEAPPVDPCDVDPCDPAADDGPPDDRPEVLVTATEFRVTEQVVCHLRRDRTLFRRGATLVVLAAGDDGRPSLKQLPAPELRERVTRAVRLQQWTGSGENAELIDVNPPKWLVDAIHCRATGHADIRLVRRVVAHPLFLADGEVLSEPGYHAATGTLLLPGSPAVTVPDAPTRADAINAAADLIDLVRDFPFATPADRAGWLAALLTPFAHASYDGPAPLFWIVKNTPGAGGSMLVQVIHRLLLGGPATLTSYTHDPAETRKQLTAWSIEGPETVVFDNVAGPFGNAPLAAAITSTQHGDRVLGVSRTHAGELRPIWMATSNNGQLVGDLHRRVLPIRLHSDDEHPEQRTGFQYPDLIGHVLANRGRLVAACLTILRAWHVAGRPTHGLTPFDFRDWSGVVREAVVFATGIDPAAHRLETADAADPEVEAVGTLIDCWPHLDPDGEGVFAATIIDRVRQARDNTAKQPDWMLALIEAVETLAGERLGCERLGLRLNKYHKRVLCGGRCLSRTGRTGGKVRWCVIRKESGPDGGGVGGVGSDQNSYPTSQNTYENQALGGVGGVGGVSIPLHDAGAHTHARARTRTHARGDETNPPTPPTPPGDDRPATPDNPPPSSDPPSAADLARLLRAAGTTWDAFRAAHVDRALDAGVYLAERLDGLDPRARGYVASRIAAFAAAA